VVDVGAVTVPIVGACGIEAGTTELVAEEATEEPLAFVATTVYVLAVVVGLPTVSVTLIGLEAPVPVNPEEEVTVYPVIADPPFAAGAVNDTDVLAEPE
jgi:hypothetical protein